MYKIIGGDQNEYGPIDLNTIRHWIAEGRVSGDTLVQREGSAEWQPLRTDPELEPLLEASPLPHRAAPEEPSGVTAQSLLNRDYSIDTLDCLARSWELFKNSFGILFGGTALFLLIHFALSALAEVRFIGFLFTLASLIISGPLMGGLYFLFLKTIRNQPASLEDLFAGFSDKFIQLLLTHLVVTVLTLLAALPGGVVLGMGAVLGATQPGAIVLIVLGGILALIPVVYLTVSWVFALPLVLDKRLDFWTAMELSRRMVSKRFWEVFVLLIALFIVTAAGFLACCVGLFVSLPLAIGALMYAYEDIFWPPTWSSAR